MKRFLIYITIALAAAGVFTAPLSAKANNPGTPFTVGADIDAAWLDGMHYMYELQFDKAREQFTGLNITHPDYPAGDLAMACLLWWQYSQDYDIPKKQAKATSDEFEGYANAAIDKSKTYLKTHHDDAGAYFAMGTAYGMLGRWYAVDRHWWKAYTHGTKARKYLRKALDLNPQIYDAYAGLGIFDYYADAVPGVLKLPALFLIHGDKKRGMEELAIAAQKGRFFTTEANLFKIAILIQFEHDSKTAIQMAQDLRASDPVNVFFRFTEFVTRFNANDWDGTISEGLKFIADLAAASANPLSTPAATQEQVALSTTTAQPAIMPQSLPGMNRQQALIYLAVGDAYVMKDNYTAALEMFTSGIHTPYPEKGWITYCYLRRGQTYELMGSRDMALADYKTAAGREDFWSTLDDAERGLKKPYSKVEIERQIEAH